MENIIPSIIQSLTLAAITAVGGAVLKIYNKASKEFLLLKDAERQDIKAEIVKTYEAAKQRGYITPLELDVTCGRYEKYKALDGNTYIDTLMERLKDFPIDGEQIPEH